MSVNIFTTHNALDVIGLPTSMILILIPKPVSKIAVSYLSYPKCKKNKKSFAEEIYLEYPNWKWDIGGITLETKF